MLNLSNRSIAVYQGPIEESAINAALVEVRDTSALSLEVEVPTSELATYRPLLERMGFRVTGSVSRTQIYLRFGKKVRDFGDGVAIAIDPHLAVPAPRLPVSVEEQNAIVVTHARLTTDGVEAKMAKVKTDSILAFDKPEVTPTLTFLQRQNTKELEDIQRTIDQMMKKSEGA